MDAFSHCTKAVLCTCFDCESTRVQGKTSHHSKSLWATLPLVVLTDSCRVAVGWWPCCNRAVAAGAPLLTWNMGGGGHR